MKEGTPGQPPGFQDLVREFVDARGLEAPVEARVLDLASEVGELSKELLGGTAYGREPFRRTDGWDGELGDAFFSLVCLANSTGVDLEEVLRETLDKYRGRLDHRGDAGSRA